MKITTWFAKPGAINGDKNVDLNPIIFTLIKTVVNKS